MARSESKKVLSSLERMASPPPAMRPEGWELAALEKIWAEARAAGHPIRVTIDAQTTLGYGCKCAHFTHYRRDADAEAYGAHQFFYPSVAPGVPPIAEWFVFGTFRLTGYFTGRSVGWVEWQAENFDHPEEPTEMQDTDPHPEFLVEGWCYDASSVDLTSDFNRETVEKMRAAGVPLCTQPMLVVAAPVPRWPTLPPDAPCTRETVRIKYRGRLEELQLWDNWSSGTTKAGSKTASAEVSVGVADGVSPEAVARDHGGVYIHPEAPDVVPEFQFPDARRAVEAVRPLLCDQRVEFVKLRTK
ncbi:hypothetical protein [Nannocystis exedens]|nr:hypothetical protein [Nannocystis exedens]